MKKAKRLSIIRKAVKIWNDDNPFGYHFIPVNISNRFIDGYFKEYPFFSMVEDSYCCYGLWQNCWEDLYEEGVWDMSKDTVKRIITSVFTENRKILKRDRRVFISEQEDSVDILVVLRDRISSDYRIHFAKDNPYI